MYKILEILKYKKNHTTLRNSIDVTENHILCLSVFNQNKNSFDALIIYLSYQTKIGNKS